MTLKRLAEENDGVSPVIGVILMVAITVILAAVIGTFVLGLGQNVQTSAPQASFSFDDKGAGNNAVVVVHDGGDSIKTGQISVQCGDGSTKEWSGAGDEVTAGESVTCSNIAGSEIVKVIWESDDGSNSQVLADYTNN